MKEKGKNGLKEVWRGNTRMLWFWGEKGSEGVPAGVGEERGGRDEGPGAGELVWAGVIWDRRRGRTMKPCSPQLVGVVYPMFVRGSVSRMSVCVCKGVVERLTAVLLLSDSAHNVAGVHEAQELWTHKQTAEVRLHRVFASMDKQNNTERTSGEER